MANLALPLVALGAVGLFLMARREQPRSSKPGPSGPRPGGPAPNWLKLGGCIARTALEGRAIEWSPAFDALMEAEGGSPLGEILPGVTTTPQGWKRWALPPGVRYPTTGCIVTYDGSSSVCIAKVVMNHPGNAELLAKMLKDYGTGATVIGPDGKEFECFSANAAPAVASLAYSAW